MKKKDSLYQLLLSIAFLILGGICFIPNINFLQQLICFFGVIILIIGVFFFIRGITKELGPSSSKILIISGLIISLIGILFSTLVWVLFELFSTTLGIIFIAYSLVGIIIVIKDKYGLKRARLLSSIKNIIYLGVGILLIIDSLSHTLIIDYILGFLLITDGIVGISAYISTYKNYHSIIEADIEEDEEIINNEED